jgi:hypothetical protein
MDAAVKIVPGAAAIEAANRKITFLRGRAIGMEQAKAQLARDRSAAAADRKAIWGALTKRRSGRFSWPKARKPGKESEPATRTSEPAARANEPAESDAGGAESAAVETESAAVSVAEAL